MRRKDLGANHGDPSWKQTTGRHVALHLVPEPVPRLMVNQQRNLDIGRYTKATEPGKIWKNLTECWIFLGFHEFSKSTSLFRQNDPKSLTKIPDWLSLTCWKLRSDSGDTPFDLSYLNIKSPTVPWHMDFKSAPPPRPFKIPALKLCSLSPGAALRNALPQSLERHCRANYSELFIATQVLRSSFCMFLLTLGLGTLPWIHLTQSCLHGKYCSIAKQKEGDPKCKPTMACLVAPPAPQGLEESLGQCPARQP